MNSNIDMVRFLGVDKYRNKIVDMSDDEKGEFL